MPQWSRWSPLGVLLLAATLILSPWAFADSAEEEGAGGEEREQEDSEKGITEYVEVNSTALPRSNTVATKLDVPLQITPTNVGVVTRPLIEEQDNVVLGDALHNVSSLNVQGGPAVHDFFSIRGFDSLSSILVLTDGAAEPQATFYPMYNIEGVEVLKSPGGFLYGRQPLGGTVNMVRKQPLPTNFAVLGGYGGSFGTAQGTLDWNMVTRENKSSFRLNGIWRESNNYRDDKESRQTAINPSFTWNLSEDLTFNFNVEYADTEISPDSGIALWAPNPLDPSNLVVPDVPRTQSYQSPFDFSDQQLLRLQIDFEARLSDSVSLRNKTYYRGLDWKSAGTLLNGTVPDFSGGFPDFSNPQVLRTLTYLDDQQVFAGNQFEAVIRASTGSVEHNILTGLELEKQYDDYAIDYTPPQLTCPPLAPCMPEIALFQPVETLTALPGVIVPLDAGELETTVVAPYVSDQMKFSDKFHLLIGLRYDRIDVKDDLRGISRDESELSPLIGAVWSPSPSLSVFGNTGRSYAPPGSRVAGDLDPQRATQVELGVKKKYLSEKMQTTFAVYRIDRDNIPIPDANGVTQQAGDQRSEGFEFEFAATPRARLWTFFNYAFNDSEYIQFSQLQPGVGPVDLSGNTPAYAPRHLVNLWVSQKFRNGLGYGVGGRYVDSQFSAPDNSYEIDAYYVLNAAGYYDWKAWRFQINVKNLTDVDYETGSFASTSVIPADPFSVFGSVEYRF